MKKKSKKISLDDYIVDNLSIIISSSLAAAVEYDKHGNTLGEGIKDCASALKAIEMLIKYKAQKTQNTVTTPKLNFIRNLDDKLI